MRVAFLTGGLPLGGSTMFILNLASALRALGLPAEVFSFSATNPLANEFSEAGVPVHLEDEKRLIYEDRVQLLYQALRIFDPTVVMSVLSVESYEMLRYLPSGVLRVGVILDMALRPQVFVPRYSYTMDHIVVIARYLVCRLLLEKKNTLVTYIQLVIPIPK